MDRKLIISDLKNYYSDTEFREKTGYDYLDIPENLLNSFYNKHCKEHLITINIKDLYDNYSNKDFLIDTPDGFKEVGDLYEKYDRDIYSIKAGKFKIKCSNDHKIETPIGWKFASDLKKGDLILTKDGFIQISYIHKCKKDTVYDLEVLYENHRYWGGNGISSHNTGKSYLSCSVCREAQKMGYTPVYLDSENAIDKDFVTRLGCDPDNFIIKQVNTIKETTNFIVNMCNDIQAQVDAGAEPPKIILVLDSLGQLTSDKERADAISGNMAVDFTKAKDTKALFRVVSIPLSKLQIPFLITNHVYCNVGSFVGGTVMSNGSGARYSGSCTLNLASIAKLQDKENDKAAEKNIGAENIKKNGVLITAWPDKSRFCIPHKIKFQIPYYKKPNPYIGLEQYLNWDNAGIIMGKCITEREFLKLKPDERAECTPYKFEYNGETLYAWPKNQLRAGVGMVCRHLGRCVSLSEFWSDTVFTPEFMKKINDEIIKPTFELPKQSSFDDIKDLEKELGGDNDETADES